MLWLMLYCFPLVVKLTNQDYDIRTKEAVFFHQLKPLLVLIKAPQLTTLTSEYNSTHPPESLASTTHKSENQLYLKTGWLFWKLT